LRWCGVERRAWGKIGHNESLVRGPVDAVISDYLE
jgi:hypothetical protein